MYSGTFSKGAGLFKSSLAGLVQSRAAATVVRIPQQHALGRLWPLIHRKQHQCGTQRASHVVSASQSEDDPSSESPSSRRERFIEGAGDGTFSAGDLNIDYLQQRLLQIGVPDALRVRRIRNLLILCMRADEIRKRDGLRPWEPVPLPTRREKWTGALRPGGVVREYSIGSWWCDEKKCRRKGKRTPQQTKEMATAAGMDAREVEKDEWWFVVDQRSNAERRQDNLRVLQLRAVEIRKEDFLGPDAPVSPPNQDEKWTVALKPGGALKPYNIGRWFHWELDLRRMCKRTSEQTKEMATAAGMDPVIVEEDTWWHLRPRSSS